MQGKTGVLLINLGTPNSPNTSDVRPYLREFLMDKRVIDIPFWKRFALINFIIAPTRAPQSAAEYKKLWTAEGSPLLFHSQKAAELLQAKLGDAYVVELAMRYQNPSISSVLSSLEKLYLEKLIVIPLFPQYASSSTGSALAEVMEHLKEWLRIPQISMLDTFVNHPKVIEAYAALTQKYLDTEEYDHILFTYHGLPERHLKKESTNCKATNCCEKYHSGNRLCYRAQCFETTRYLAAKLGLSKENYTISFQSRLGKTPWIKPYTDEVIVELAKQGKKKVLALSPSFVADCLETTVEIGETYDELFKEHGGEKWQLVESLNSDPTWIEALQQMVMDL